jgi:hypothetical protein
VGEAFASAADGLVQQQSLEPDLPTEQILASLFERIIDSGEKILARRPGRQKTSASRTNAKAHKPPRKRR